MKETVIKIRHRYNNKIIFEYYVSKNIMENNVFAKAVEEAVKQGVSLAYANLSNVCLSNTNLENGDFSNASLSHTDLYSANLKNTNLSNADLYCSNLRNTNLYEANLVGADLTGATVIGANFENACLIDTNLNNTFMAKVILKNASINYPMACPETGSFIGWKIVKHTKRNYHDFLVKLEIPAEAKRSSATTDKCRCEFAKVLEIWDLLYNVNLSEVTNYNIKETVYKVGEMVYPDKWDDNRWNECSNGIHFFMNQKDAINY